LGPNLALSLGNAGAWIANPFGNDIEMEVLLTDGRTRKVPVTYNGMSDNPIELGDFNGNGTIDAADWPTVRDNFNADLTGMTLLQRYARGDLNNDGRNDRFDFAQFKALFDAANGAGSFNAVLGAVPEPGSLTILAVGTGLIGLGLRRRSSEL
jgi:hypothetical protein